MNKTAQRGFRIVVTTYQCHYSCPANEQSGNATINADSETAAESECVATQATGCPDLSCTCSPSGV